MTFVMTIPDEMRQKYISRRMNDLKALREALAQNDFELFSKVGHQLKGNAATFGYDSLGLLGEKMEDIAQTKNHNEAEACLNTLDNWITENKTN
jgi:HPt (histidine-containing phosphotransfer) domain-containing protein